jgi:NAD(P)H-dependent FMN reductase
MQILAVSGSLRAVSKNTAVLEAARSMAPPGVEVTPYGGLGDLPQFNPDHDTPEGRGGPPPVADWRARVARADGVIISTPEYAHGLPGALKNALDWLVSNVDFPEKPVALLGASPLSVHAPAQLAEILRTMSARLVPEASVTVPLLGPPMSAEAIAADPELSRVLREAVEAFVRAIGEAR